MDNLTHSLTGLALSRAGLNRFCPRAVWLLLLSANAPDADIVMTFRGALPYFEAHRGYSHSLVGLPVMALLSLLIVAGVFRERLPWTRAMLVCLVGVASHLLLDLTNTYGVRLLLPFSSRWFYLDLNGLYDAWILAILVFVALWSLLAGLVSREIGDRSPVGRPVAILGLTCFLLFDVGRSVLHNRAVAQMQSRLYDGEVPRNIGAFPAPFSPLQWTGAIETEGGFRVLNLDPLVQLDPEGARRYFKAPLSESLQAARATEPFRFLQYFARFPLWSEQEVPIEGHLFRRVELCDLRFGAPGAGSFHAIALVNQRRQIVGSWFTYGSGSDLGWSPANQAPDSHAQ